MKKTSFKIHAKKMILNLFITVFISFAILYAEYKIWQNSSSNKYELLLYLSLTIFLLLSILSVLRDYVLKIELQDDRIKIKYLGHKKRMFYNPTIKDCKFVNKNKILTIEFLNNKKSFKLCLFFFLKEDREEISQRFMELLLDNTKDFDTKKMEDIYGKSRTH